MVRIAPARRQSCSSRGPCGFLAAVLLLASQTGLPASALARSPSAFPVFGENGYGSAFLCDSSGLFLTEQRLVTGAIPPRIVISPNLVVRARVLVENPDRGIAVLWVNSADVAGMDVMPLAHPEPEAEPVAPGDSIRVIEASARAGLESRRGSVRRAGEHQFESDLPPEPGGAGGPVLNEKGEVIGVLLSAGKGSPPGALATLIGEALPLLAAAADSARALPQPAAETLPPIPNELYPVAELHTLAKRQRDALDEYQIATAGYLISVLTPPICYALEAEQPEDAGRWLLWGAFEGEYRPVVAVHVQTTKHAPSILWPLGAIARLGKGTARVFASIVGTIEDGVTGGGPEPVFAPARKRDHCEVELLRNGRPVEPVLCQCSGHTFDSKRAAFVPRKGSTAAFFYFGWQTFKPAGSSPPEIALSLFDPSRPDETETIQIPRKMLDMIAADLKPVQRYQQGLPHPPLATGTGGATPLNGSTGGRQAIFLVRLRGGSVLRALEVAPRGAHDLGIVLEAGERILVSGEEVNSILDESGNDWTARVVVDHKGVPEGHKE